MNFEPYLRTWLVPRIPQLVTVEVHGVSAPGRVQVRERRGSWRRDTPVWLLTG